MSSKSLVLKRDLIPYPPSNPGIHELLDDHLRCRPSSSDEV